MSSFNKTYWLWEISIGFLPLFSSFQLPKISNLCNPFNIKHEEDTWFILHSNKIANIKTKSIESHPRKQPPTIHSPCNKLILILPWTAVDDIVWMAKAIRIAEAICGGLVAQGGLPIIVGCDCSSPTFRLEQLALGFYCCNVHTLSSLVTEWNYTWASLLFFVRCIFQLEQRNLH